MKIVRVPVEVELKKGWPVMIHWEHRHMRVRQVSDWWVARERWWSREEERVYFRLVTDTGTVEVYRLGDKWILARMFD
jgi:hypothetical protein